MLLFIDNIFRFVQAGSEVSALLGRMPSQVGYQPTLESEMGQLQERITSTRKGSVTSIQAIYVPGGRPHRPGAGLGVRPPQRDHDAVAGDLREGHLPGGRPARLDVDDPQARDRRRGALQRRQRGQGGAAALPRAAGHHRHPRHRRALRRGPRARAARAQDRALPVAAVPRRRAVHGHARRLRADRRDRALVPRDPRRQARRPPRGRVPAQGLDRRRRRGRGRRRGQEGRRQEDSDDEDDEDETKGESKDDSDDESRGDVRRRRTRRSPSPRTTRRRTTPTTTRRTTSRPWRARRSRSRS